MSSKSRAIVTPVRPVAENFHGVVIQDLYRWLEDGEGDEVKEWTEQQNSVTRHWLDNRPERAILLPELKTLMQTGFVHTPVKHGNRYFFTSRGAEDNQAVLCVRESGQDRVLINPADLREDGTVALDWWSPSLDGSLVAYGLSEAGDEISTLHILRVATGELLPDRIPFTRFCSVAWLPDNSGFFYSRNPTPGTVPPSEEKYNRNIFSHHIGDDPANDLLIYKDTDPQCMPEVSISRDGRYLLILAFHGWSKVNIHWRDLSQPDSKFINLNKGLEGIFSCEFAEESLYILTNWEAPNYRILKAQLKAPFQENWQEIIPEGLFPIQSLKIAGEKLVVDSLENAISLLHLYDQNGNLQGEVPLPAAGTVYAPVASSEDEEILFAFTSFVYPMTAYSYLPSSQKLTVFKAPVSPAGFDPASVTVKQVWYTSKDGTKISMFLVHLADLELDGKRPTILTGYGGFNISRTPEFGSGTLRVWLERGGVYALTNLRGGGEYGENWHTSGMLGQKQNTFDDFAAAAEWLIANGYTNSQKLACQGGSNGGLLVGAAITQHPELFQAAVCAVPLLDMLRYHHFQIARLWIPEYGSSEDLEQFKWLQAYSPYHQVNTGTHYPATLLMAGEQDSRVDPLHARKMAALLQASTGSNRPILLRIETRAGHGQGKPISKLVEEQADIWTFMAWQLGLKV
jgi:prolyl oligopeptidase